MNLQNDKCAWEQNFSQAEVAQIGNTDTLFDLSEAEWDHINNSKDIVLLKLMNIAISDECNMNL